MPDIILRITQETLERIDVLKARLELQERRSLHRSTVLLQILDAGCAVLEQRLEAPIAEQGMMPPEETIATILKHTTLSPEMTLSQEAAIAADAPLLTLAPHGAKAVPAHLRAIADAYPQATHLSLDEFAEVLYERNLYRAMDKSGHERPVQRGTLKKMLDRCKKLGLLR